MQFANRAKRFLEGAVASPELQRTDDQIWQRIAADAYDVETVA